MFKSHHMIYNELLMICGVNFMNFGRIMRLQYFYFLLKSTVSNLTGGC